VTTVTASHFQISKASMKAVLMKAVPRTFISFSPPASYLLVLSNAKLLAGNPLKRFEYYSSGPIWSVR
jgi:hypothetical protein